MENQLTFKLDGQTVTPFQEWEGLEINIDFTGDQNELEVKIDDATFVKKANEILRAKRDSGLSGGVGVFEGVPFQISAQGDNNTIDVLDGYVDLSDGAVWKGCDSVKAKIKKAQSVDWLSDVAGSFSFASLYAEGIVKTSDFIQVPYIINYVPDNAEVITIIISGYLMVKETVEAVKRLVELISWTINAATPNVGAGVTLDIGDVIQTILTVLMNIAIIILMVVAVIELSKQLLEQYFPRKRFHLGMTLKRMFEVFCQKLDLTFESTIMDGFWGSAVYLPQKDVIGGEEFELGVPTNGEAVYRGDGFISVMKEMFNADYKIKDGVFRFDQSSYWQNISTYTLPNTYQNQEDLRNDYTLNTSELKSNYFITYATDQNDQNTLRNYKGINYQAVTDAITIDNKKYKNIKGLEEIRLPFSLGVEKQGLEPFEKALKSAAKIIDKVTGIFGAGTAYASKIEDRKGSLLMSSHYIGTPRLIAMQGSKLAQNQRSILAAKKLWEFHKSKSFVPIDGVHNQYLLFNEHKVPFCLNNLVNLLDNNFFKTSDSKEGKIETIKWAIRKNTATFDYRVNEIYTDNLKISYNEGGV
ncbi:MAG: hypothetical protein WDZ41_01910 [Candidatus Babeliales bacterium]